MFMSKENNKIFEDLFVLEIANNHWGSVERGKKIIHEYSRVIRHNNVKAAIKFQFRDVDSFIHPDFADREDMRYVWKTKQTKLSEDQMSELVQYTRNQGMYPMATCFDETSVDLFEKLGLDIMKVASSDINDWPLLEKIASIRKPTIVSSGGSSLKDVDDIVSFFAKKNVPLALNHCVSLYPSEDFELELNQIDFLKNRFPDTVIGFSSHEMTSWQASMFMSYAKGARTWERHVDIDDGEYTVSPYCSLPEQIDEWLNAYHLAKEMCGAPGIQKRIPVKREVEYLDKLVRGVYAKKELKKGQILTKDDYFMAIPLQHGQLSCRELVEGEIVLSDISINEPISVDKIDTPYGRNQKMREKILKRGFDVTRGEKDFIPKK
jgi:sialic acid synthase SpsE